MIEGRSVNQSSGTSSSFASPENSGWGNDLDAWVIFGKWLEKAKSEEKVRSKSHNGNAVETQDSISTRVSEKLGKGVSEMSL